MSPPGKNFTYVIMVLFPAQAAERRQTISVGHYSVTVPARSFFKVGDGYVYQKRVSNIFLRVYIKNTSTPGHYTLLAYGGRGALTNTATSPVPVTLVVGDDSGSAEMNAKFD